MILAFRTHDTCFQKLIKIIWDTSEANLQVCYSNKNSYKSKSFFQLPSDIETIKNDLNSPHRLWKDTGFDKQSTSHVDFKAKRNEYRSAIRKFIQGKENSKIVDLCKASEVDEKLFWKMLKRAKGRAKLPAFWLMESLSTQIQLLPICGLIILKHWDNQLLIIHINESIKIKVESSVEQIFTECVSTLSCTEPLFVFDIVKEVCQGLKCGVAGGPDMTTCEH